MFWLTLVVALALGWGLDWAKIKEKQRTLDANLVLIEKERKEMEPLLRQREDPFIFAPTNKADGAADKPAKSRDTF